MTKKKEEPEVITFKDLVERNKNIKKEELFKFVLVCRNCSHKDLLGKFVKKKEKGEGFKFEPLDKPKPYPTPFKPSPDLPTPWRPSPPIKYKYYTKSRIGSKNINNILIDNKEYEDMFFCPKCDSSLVVLDPDYVKNNILRGIESG